SGFTSVSMTGIDVSACDALAQEIADGSGKGGDECFAGGQQESEEQETDLSGTWDVTTSGASCIPQSTDLTVTGSGNSYASSYLTSTISMSVTGPTSCGMVFNTQTGVTTCTSCSLSLQGSGAAGSTITMGTCGNCSSMVWTKQ
ncbi:MAG: hypothetical protein HY465_00040, partial [Deltaproteobacteria bacterium]|nr:hypothetical protein [Deltaproteobacteria bacterium]